MNQLFEVLSAFLYHDVFHFISFHFDKGIGKGIRGQHENPICVLKALRARRGKERCQQAGRMLRKGKRRSTGCSDRDCEILDFMQVSQVENSKTEYESRTVI